MRNLALKFLAIAVTRSQAILPNSESINHDALIVTSPRVDTPPAYEILSSQPSAAHLYLFKCVEKV